MGIFDSIFGDSSSNSSIGQKVLTAYYNEASSFTEFQFPSYDAWIAYLVARVPGFVENVGELVNGNYHATTVDQSMSRMADLANQSEGKATIGQLVQAAGGSGDSVNWFAAANEVTEDTLSDVADIAYDVSQSVSTGVLGSLSMVKYLPFILLGAGALYLYTTGSSIGKILKK